MRVCLLFLYADKNLHPPLCVLYGTFLYISFFLQALRRLRIWYCYKTAIIIVIPALRKPLRICFQKLHRLLLYIICLSINEKFILSPSPLSVHRAFCFSPKTLFFITALAGHQEFSELNGNSVSSFITFALINVFSKFKIFAIFAPLNL